MRVVIDTNVLVSGLLTPFGKAADILRLVTLDRITLCLDARILAAYRVALHRPKFGFNSGAVAVLLKELEPLACTVVGIPLRGPLPDPDDNMFLEIALGSDAVCIITGNRDHFPQNRCGKVRIFSPGDFFEQYQENSE
ncbi:putative toxin-antitoxin system toxin component, PIN family [bacterium]|nr:putative toxin-antitoxin system toxin component, PIN family [bacterium]